MPLPESYIVSLFYQENGAVKYNRLARTYQGSCGLCREGDSWLKKRRAYYIPKKNLICCHNCGYTSSADRWAAKVTGKSILTLHTIASKESDFVLPEVEEVEEAKVCELPADAVELFTTQTDYYKECSIIQKAQDYLIDRRLNTACNKSRYFVSFDDYVHKNRIIIPFYDNNNKLLFFQSRQLLEDVKMPRYISSTGFEKTIFGINNIQPESSTVIIHEGPFNSTFTKNGLAVGGIQESSSSTFTATQQAQFNSIAMLEKIWLLDSQWLDTASFHKTKILLEQGESVFLWPQQLGTKFKDVNDMCKALGRDGITHQFIKKHTFKGLSGMLEFSRITPPSN